MSVEDEAEEHREQAFGLELSDRLEAIRPLPGLDAQREQLVSERSALGGVDDQTDQVAAGREIPSNEVAEPIVGKQDSPHARSVLP